MRHNPLITRRWHLVLALVLALAHLGAGYALTLGLENSGFGDSQQCTLTGWRTYGIAKTEKTSDGKCYALIMANTAGSGSRGGTTNVSGIEQIFVVQPNAPKLSLFLKPYSDRPNTPFEAQTIIVRDSMGGVIYKQSRNSQVESENHNNLLDLDLSAYAGQSVRLNIEVQIDTSNPNSPTAVHLDIDNLPIIVGQGPDMPPGGGW